MTHVYMDRTLRLRKALGAVRFLVASLISTFSLVAAMTAAAEVTLENSVQKVETFVDEAGDVQRRLIGAESVVPGDELRYTITFTNISGEAAENVVITNPIADSLIYVDGSAFGPGTEIQFSIDGGRTFAPREALTITEEGVVRAASVEDFTHIRWVMQQELAAGAQGVARFAAVLE